MTISNALANRNGGPHPATYDDAVASFAANVVAYWKFAETSGLVANDQQGRINASYAGSPRFNVPTIVQPDEGGTCVGLPGSAGNHIDIPHNDALKNAEGTIVVTIQRDSSESKAIIVAGDANNAAGGFSIEVLASGAIRGYLRRQSDGEPVILTGPERDVEVGEAYTLVFKWGAAGLSYSLRGAGGLIRQLTAPFADGLSGPSAIRVGAWHNGVDCLHGTIARLVWLHRQITDDEESLLAKPRTIQRELPGGGSERDAFWADEGYTLAWHSTPTAADVGQPVNNYWTQKWNNGHSLAANTFNSSQGTLAVVEAPDGSPAVRGQIFEGGVLVALVRGQQLGPNGQGDHAVFSVEMWNPEPGGLVHNGKRGIYTGIGHHWGARPGVTRTAGGSTNFSDAYSLRVVMGGSPPLRWFLYVYPARPDSSSDPGQSFGQSTGPNVNQWDLVEAEVIANTPGQSDGRLRLYVNGTRIKEVKNYAVRLTGDTKPKGAGFFLRHNSRAPSEETLYWRNWRIYTK